MCGGWGGWAGRDVGGQPGGGFAACGRVGKLQKSSIKGQKVRQAGVQAAAVGAWVGGRS